MEILFGKNVGHLSVILWNRMETFLKAGQHLILSNMDDSSAGLSKMNVEHWTTPQSSLIAQSLLLHKAMGKDKM